jgi:hypothetical protein
VLEILDEPFHDLAFVPRGAANWRQTLRGEKRSTVTLISQPLRERVATAQRESNIELVRNNFQALVSQDQTTTCRYGGSRGTALMRTPGGGRGFLPQLEFPIKDRGKRTLGILADLSGMQGAEWKARWDEIKCLSKYSDHICRRSGSKATATC